jgi:hypothetical protein
MQCGRRLGFLWILIVTTGLLCLGSVPALAGPPFTTDDPEPTPYRSYEIYIASDYARSADGVDVTTPHFEFNYGLLPNVQVTVTLPLAGTKQPHGPMLFGYGDTEFEVKARVIQETDHLPQISFGPTIVVPSGNANRNLGAGHTQTMLPLWAEKGFGKYTVFGGGGVWLNPGLGNKNYVFSGVGVLRDLSHGWTVGTEIFGQSADTIDATSSVGYNFGAIRQYDEHHEFLFSLGRSLHGSNTLTAYAALGFLLGPRDKADAGDKVDAGDKGADSDKPGAGDKAPAADKPDAGGTESLPKH